MTRHEIINSLISRHGYASYLEIGVGDGSTLNKVACQIKHGVDPEGSAASYQMTSDEFFSRNEAVYDIVFVDGLHLAEQVAIDIDNSLYVLSDDGAIVVHDCLPKEEYQQLRERIEPKGPWTGDAWKAFAELRFSRPDLEMFTIDCDWGCGVIMRGSQDVLDRPDALDWDYFVRNRQDLMAVVTEGEWLEYLGQGE